MRASSWLMSLSITTVLGVGLSGCGGASDRPTDPMAGTWALNVQKSSYDPAPGPKSQTVVISGTDQARKLVVDVTPDIGPAMHWEVAGPTNQDLPVTGVNPNADTYAFKRRQPEHDPGAVQEGRTQHHHADGGRVGRRQDDDRDRHRHQRLRAAGEDRGRVRTAALEPSAP